MKRTFLFLSMFVLTASIFAQNVDYTLHLKHRKVLVPENAEFIINTHNKSAISNAYENMHYCFVQFYQSLDEDTHIKLKKLGIEVLGYLPPFTYYVSIPESLDSKKLGNLGIRSFFNLEARDKIANNLLDKSLIPEKSRKGNGVSIKIMFASNIDPKIALAKISNLYSVSNIETSNKGNVLDIAYNDILKIAELPFVYHVYPAERDITLDNNNIAPHTTLAPITSTNTGYPGLTGEGLTVVLGDIVTVKANTDEAHYDFHNRYTIYPENPWIGDHDHGIHCSGTMVGAGNIDPRYRGVAPGADLISCVFGSNGNQYAREHPEVKVCSYSLAGKKDGIYSADSYEIDTTLNRLDYLVSCWSAGNAVDMASINGDENIGKNVITVGAHIYPDSWNVNNRYSKGPTEDGRIKPEIVGLGSVISTVRYQEYSSKTGTSMSTPLIAGVTTLMYESFQNNNNNQDPDGALIKAILCNTARDLDVAGPDFSNGFGYANARRAIKAIEDKRYASTQLSEGASFDFDINVPSGASELKVMICWNDPAGNVLSAKSLVNDLDLTIEDPLGATYNPWVLNPASSNWNDPAVRGVDRTNNIEQVTIDYPTAGAYTATINGYDLPMGGSQKVWITYEIVYQDEFFLTYPIGGESFDPEEDISISWDYSGEFINSNKLEISTDNGNTWVTIFNNSYSLDEMGHFMALPNVQSDECLVRLTIDGVAKTSGRFTILDKPTNTVAVYANNSTAQLSWSPVSGATGYNLYKLGNKYMEYVGSTTDRKYTFTNLDNASNNEWLAVTAKIGNGESRRTIALRPVPAPTTSPIVEFRGDPTSFEKGTTVQFTDLSTNYATDWLWSFPGGNPSTSTERNPIVTYSDIGNYEVTLTVTNYNSNASLTKSSYINTYNVGDCITTFPYHESFENQTTNLWVQESNDDFDWTIATRRTPTGATGPQTNDYADGIYWLYTEAIPDVYNKTARLTSPCLDFSNLADAEISFQYNMIGDNMGTLAVQASSDGSNWTTIWSKSGEQGTAWNQATVDLSAYDGEASAYVRFGGTVGDYVFSDMAIDDILIDGTIIIGTPPTADFGGCGTIEEGESISFANNSTDAATYQWSFPGGTPSTSTAENPSVTYSNDGIYDVTLIAINAHGSDTITTQGCVVVQDPPPTFCANPITTFPYTEGFESGIGSFEQDINDDFDWETNSGGTPSSSTGPSSANEGSYYIFTESSNPNYPTKTAIIYTPCFNISSLTSPVFKFDYHMYGSTMGTLEMDITTDGINYTNIFTKSGDQGNQWNSEAIDLSAYSGDIKIRITGTTSTSYRSDFALDNIFLGNDVIIVPDCYISDVTMTLVTDNYGYETTWELKDESGTVVYSNTTGSYGNNTTYTETFQLTAGNYTFTIEDSFGDGICCSYGNGSYELKDANNEIIVSGGSFATTESTDFCIEGTDAFALGISDIDNSQFTLYPNPTNDKLNIELAFIEGEIRIYNSLGSIVYAGEINKTKETIDVSNFIDGIYTVLIINNDQRMVSKFVKK